MAGYIFGITPVQFKQNVIADDSSRPSVSQANNNKQRQSEFERLLNTHDQTSEPTKDAALTLAQQEQQAQFRLEKLKRDNAFEACIAQARSNLQKSTHTPENSMKKQLENCQHQLNWLLLSL